MMKSEERGQLDRAFSEARDDIRNFLESCVPAPLLKFFPETAKKHFPELFDECAQLKIKISSNTNEDTFQQKLHMIRRFSYVSKQLIRLTAVKLLLRKDTRAEKP